MNVLCDNPEQIVPTKFLAENKKKEWWNKLLSNFIFLKYVLMINAINAVF